MLYKSLHGQAPTYLQNATCPQGEGNQRYALRNQNIPIYRSRTSTFHNSFIPKTVREWNSLPNELKSAGTLDTFTNKLDSDLCTTPKWFYVGDRRIAIVHARMRMLCSELNDHLFSHIHVVDSPVCKCGHHRENNKHYLLDCPLYINERTEMLNHLANIKFKPTVSNLLNGSDAYSSVLNVQAFGYIHDYIKATKRFS